MPELSPAAQLVQSCRDYLDALEEATLALRRRAEEFRNPLVRNAAFVMQCALPLQQFLDVMKRHYAERETLATESLALISAALTRGDFLTFARQTQGMLALQDLRGRTQEAEAGHEAAKRDMEQAEADMRQRLAS